MSWETVLKIDFFRIANMWLRRNRENIERDDYIDMQRLLKRPSRENINRFLKMARKYGFRG
jgi:hypothetical protein